MFVNLKTGEMLDFAEWTDEEILTELRDLEEIYQAAKLARDAARRIIIDRMEQDGAKLRLTSVGKARLRKSSRVRDKKLVEQLYELCPPEMKEKCFDMELKPRKAGLNELAKLGNDWETRVNALYDETSYLVVDWEDPDPKAESKGDTPF